MTENNEKKDKKQRWGSGGGTGDSIRPSTEPEVESSVEGEHSVREIPIGIPMDPEEFKRLKAQAEQPSREEEGRQDEADEDNSATQGD